VRVTSSTRLNSGRQLLSGTGEQLAGTRAGDDACDCVDAGADGSKKLSGTACALHTTAAAGAAEKRWLMRTARAL
jgi:hypothetical protein